GHRVVVCDDDNTARVWDTATGMPVTPSLHHRGAVLYGAFSPDGRRLITAADDRTAREWDAFTGELVDSGLHTLAIKRVFFRADGEEACAADDGGVVTTWNLAPDERPIEELVALAQVEACGSIDESQELKAFESARLRGAWEKLHPAEV